VVNYDDLFFYSFGGYYKLWATKTIGGTIPNDLISLVEKYDSASHMITVMIISKSLRRETQYHQ